MPVVPGRSQAQRDEPLVAQTEFPVPSSVGEQVLAPDEAGEVPSKLVVTRFGRAPTTQPHGGPEGSAPAVGQPVLFRLGSAIRVAGEPHARREEGAGAGEAFHRTVRAVPDLVPVVHLEPAGDLGRAQVSGDEFRQRHGLLRPQELLFLRRLLHRRRQVREARGEGVGRPAVIAVPAGGGEFVPEERFGNAVGEGLEAKAPAVVEPDLAHGPAVGGRAHGRAQAAHRAARGGGKFRRRLRIQWIPGAGGNLSPGSHLTVAVALEADRGAAFVGDLAIVVDVEGPGHLLVVVDSIDHAEGTSAPATEPETKTAPWSVAQRRPPPEIADPREHLLSKTGPPDRRGAHLFAPGVGAGPVARFGEETLPVAHADGPLHSVALAVLVVLEDQEAGQGGDDPEALAEFDDLVAVGRRDSAAEKRVEMTAGPQAREEGVAFLIRREMERRGVLNGAALRAAPDDDFPALLTTGGEEAAEDHLLRSRRKPRQRRGVDARGADAFDAQGEVLHRRNRDLLDEGRRGAGRVRIDGPDGSPAVGGQGVEHHRLEARAGGEGVADDALRGRQAADPGRQRAGIDRVLRADAVAEVDDLRVLRRRGQGRGQRAVEVGPAEGGAGVEKFEGGLDGLIVRRGLVLDQPGEPAIHRCQSEVIPLSEEGEERLDEVRLGLAVRRTHGAGGVRQEEEVEWAGGRVGRLWRGRGEEQHEIAVLAAAVRDDRQGGRRAETDARLEVAVGGGVLLLVLDPGGVREGPRHRFVGEAHGVRDRRRGVHGEADGELLERVVAEHLAPQGIPVTVGVTGQRQHPGVADPDALLAARGDGKDARLEEVAAAPFQKPGVLLAALDVLVDLPGALALHQVRHHQFVVDPHAEAGDGGAGGEREHELPLERPAGGVDERFGDRGLGDLIPDDHFHVVEAQAQGDVPAVHISDQRAEPLAGGALPIAREPGRRPVLESDGVAAAKKMADAADDGVETAGALHRDRCAVATGDLDLAAEEVEGVGPGQFHAPAGAEDEGAAARKRDLHGVRAACQHLDRVSGSEDGARLEPGPALVSHRPIDGGPREIHHRPGAPVPLCAGEPAEGKKAEKYDGEKKEPLAHARLPAVRIVWRLTAQAPILQVVGRQLRGPGLTFRTFRGFPVNSVGGHAGGNVRNVRPGPYSRRLSSRRRSRSSRWARRSSSARRCSSLSAFIISKSKVSRCSFHQLRHLSMSRLNFCPVAACSALVANSRWLLVPRFRPLLANAIRASMASFDGTFATAMIRAFAVSWSSSISMSRSALIEQGWASVSRAAITARYSSTLAAPFERGARR